MTDDGRQVEGTSGRETFKRCRQDFIGVKPHERIIWNDRGQWSESGYIELQLQKGCDDW